MQKRKLASNKKSLKQLGASAVEYGLALAVILTMVVAGAKLMKGDIDGSFTKAAAKVKEMVAGG